MSAVSSSTLDVVANSTVGADGAVVVDVAGGVAAAFAKSDADADAYSFVRTLIVHPDWIPELTELVLVYGCGEYLDLWSTVYDASPMAREKRVVAAAIGRYQETHPHDALNYDTHVWLTKERHLWSLHSNKPVLWDWHTPSPSDPNEIRLVQADERQCAYRYAWCSDGVEHMVTTTRPGLTSPAPVRDGFFVRLRVIRQHVFHQPVLVRLKHFGVDNVWTVDGGYRHLAFQHECELPYTLHAFSGNGVSISVNTSNVKHTRHPMARQMLSALYKLKQANNKLDTFCLSTYNDRLVMKNVRPSETDNDLQWHPFLWKRVGTMLPRDTERALREYFLGERSVASLLRQKAQAWSMIARGVLSGDNVWGHVLPRHMHDRCTCNLPAGQRARDILVPEETTTRWRPTHSKFDYRIHVHPHYTETGDFTL